MTAEKALILTIDGSSYVFVCHKWLFVIIPSIWTEIGSDHQASHNRLIHVVKALIFPDGETLNEKVKSSSVPISLQEIELQIMEHKSAKPEKPKFASSCTNHVVVFGLHSLHSCIHTFLEPGCIRFILLSYSVAPRVGLTGDTNCPAGRRTRTCAAHLWCGA